MKAPSERRTPWRSLMKGAATGFFVLWPLLILWAARTEGLGAVLWISLALFVVRAGVAFVVRSPREGALFTGGAALTGWALATDELDWALYYPVFVNAVLLVFFAATLVKGPSMIERFARIAEGGELPPEGVAYTRRLTFWWCLFFVGNGSIALATVLSGNLEWWTLWNGALSYVAIGLFIGGEYLYRKKVLHV